MRILPLTRGRKGNAGTMKIVRFERRLRWTRRTALTLTAAAGALALFAALTIHPFAAHTAIASAADSASLASGAACTGQSAFQATDKVSVTAQVCAQGLAGSTINPKPYVNITSAPDMTLAPDDFQAGCSIDIQLLDAAGNVLSDANGTCQAGIHNGAPYTYNGVGMNGSPSTTAVYARALLHYQATTIDLGTSPAYTAGLHRCTGPGTMGIASGGDPATFTFDAGQDVVLELDSTDPFGTPVSADLGPNVNGGAESASGISMIGAPFYADFSKWGTEPAGWTVTVSSTLGADVPADGGPAGNGLLGGAGDVAWVLYSDYCASDQ